MDRICHFCKQPISDNNYQEIFQTQFVEPSPEGVLFTRVGKAPVIYIHAVCGLPVDCPAPVNRVSERQVSSRVFYVDVGDLPPPEVATYLQRVLEVLKKSKGPKAQDEGFLVVPVRQR